LEQAVLAAAASPALIENGATVGAREAETVAGATAALMAKFAMPLLIAGGLTIGGIVGYVLGTKNPIPQSNTPANISSVTNVTSEQSHQADQPVTGESVIQEKASSGASRIGSRPGRTNMASQSSATRIDAAPAANAAIPTTTSFADPSPNTIQKLLATGNVPVAHTVAIVVSSQGTEHITGLMQHDNDQLHANSWQPDEDDSKDTLNYQLELQEGGGALLPNLSSSNLSTAPLINTTALRFGVNIWDGAMFGIGIGQSTFGLRYSSQPDALTTVTYMQYSSLWYTGLYLQQSLPPIIGLTPRALVELAGTNLGALGNMQVGLSYPISHSVYVGINGIVSDLMYRHAGAWLNSQKIGLMFGIGTEF
jgi:hypothetical protein